MALLDSIHGPADLRLLSAAELDTLAEEIRAFLISSVSGAAWGLLTAPRIRMSAGLTSRP